MAAVAGATDGLIDITSKGTGTKHLFTDQTGGFGAWSVSGAGGGDIAAADLFAEHGEQHGAHSDADHADGQFGNAVGIIEVAHRTGDVAGDHHINQQIQLLYARA